MHKFATMYLPKPGSIADAMPVSWYTAGAQASLAAIGHEGEQVAPIATGGEQWLVKGASAGVAAWCEVRAWEEYGAIEWVGRLQNQGVADSPLLERIAAADVEIEASGEALTIHHAHGSTCQITDFLPLETRLCEGEVLELAPAGGRSSNATLPFLNIAWEGGGVIIAIGWSGQWKARIEYVGGKVRLWVGQEHTRLRLRPGEQIRTPRVLLVFWQGVNPYVGNNALRHLLIDHYLPRHEGKLQWPPVTHNTWFAFNEGNDVTEENQIAIIERLAELKLGVEMYWLDAGWFEGGWPHGVGSWVPKAEAFPRGLRPLADAAHKHGMGFVVWFEPERVNPHSRIGREHPEFVLHGGPLNWTQENDGLYNLGDPEARRYLTDLLSTAISEYGIDVYRNDFNIDPLPFWRAADEPEREGITEIRYIEGLYEMWDELLRRKPGMLIDNCASGGRRIDLETTARSLPLWRSDTQCSQKALPIFDQVQTSGLSRWAPLNSAGAWSFDPYSFWSVAQAGVNVQPYVLAPDFPVELVRQRLDELKRWRELWLGNFWPLTPVTTSEEDWCAWQLHDPEHNGGIVMAFRRAAAPEAVVLELEEIDGGETYVLRDELTGMTEEVQGSGLQRMQVETDSQPGVRILSYWRL